MDSEAARSSGAPTAERLGLLGGTFDPVHVGHLVAARTVLEVLHLERVLLVVAGDPWQKSGRVHAAARDRLEMVEAAVAGVPGLEASSIEVTRAGPSYTADTLAELSSPGRDLFLIVGSDVAARLDTWVRVEEVKRLATLVMVERAGDDPAGADLAGWRVERVAMPRIDVSSTEIRRRVADGLRVDFEVPAGAVRIIEDRCLYTRRDDEGRDRRRRERRDLRYQAWVVSLALLAGIAAGIAGEPRVTSAGTVDTLDVSPDTPTTTGSARGPDAGEADRAPRPRTLLLGHVGDDGHLDLLVALAVAEGHDQGAVLLIPTATLVEVPSLETQALVDVVRMGSLGGPDLLQTSVENALGTGFDDLLLTDDKGLIALTAPAGTMTVDFGRAFRIDDDAGTLAFTSGIQEIDAATAVRLLIAGGSRGELDHLVTIQAVMQGWMAAIREEETAAATLAAARGARTLVLASSAVLRYDTLPVVSVASGGEERFVVRRDDARSLFERTMPWALLGDEPRPRVEILNGTGEVGVTQSVAKAVVREGVEVTLTGNLPGFGADTTQVLYYRDEGAATAEALAAALGIGVVVKAPRPVDVIDVTIVVGADLATGQDRDQGPDQE